MSNDLRDFLRGIFKVFYRFIKFIKIWFKWSFYGNLCKDDKDLGKEVKRSWRR